MNRSFFTKATMVATLSLGAVAASVSTAAAQSSVNFVGSANLRDQPGSGGANLLIDFLTGTPPTMGGVAPGTITAVPTINGAFMPGIMNGMQGTIQDLVVSEEGVVGRPINPFVTLGGFTFTLNSTPDGNTFGPVSLFNIGTGTLASFGVSGDVTGGSFGTNSRSFEGVFTAQFAGLTPTQVFNRINTGGALPVGFSAEFTVGVIPEPSTYALLATGIGALGVVARRRRQQA